MLDLLRAPDGESALLVTGSQVECLLARHADAQVAHPMGLLDFLCQQAEAAGVAPPPHTSWSPLRQQLSERAPNLGEVFEQVQTALAHNQTEAKQIWDGVQKKLANLQIRDQQFADALRALNLPIYGLSYTQLANQISTIGSQIIPIYSPDTESQLSSIEPFCQSSYSGENLFTSILNRITESTNIIFLGFGSPADPILLRFFDSIHTGTIISKKIYMLRDCRDIKIPESRNWQIIYHHKSEFINTTRELSLRSLISDKQISSASNISRTELRQIMDKQFPASSDLDAFILDNFDDVYRKFTDSMDRTQKINMLFSMRDTSVVHKKLNDVSTDLSIKSDQIKRLNKNDVRVSDPVPNLMSDEAKDLLLNPYSFVLADGHGPENLLECEYSGDAFHQTTEGGNKTHWLHRESRLKADPSRELLGAPARESYLPDLVPTSPPIRQMNALVARVKAKRPLLHLLIRLLPPGVHISLSVVPVLEKLILENQRHRVLHTLMPDLGGKSYRNPDIIKSETGEKNEPRNRNQPGMLIRTYYPHRAAEDTPLHYKDVAEFLKRIQRDSRDEYFILRPYSGYVLGAGLAARDQLEGITGRIQFTLTEDYHIAVPKYGVFGIAHDRILRTALTADCRRVVYADFEMVHPATRTMHQWVDPQHPPRAQDMVLRPRGLFPVDVRITDTDDEHCQFRLSQDQEEAGRQADRVYAEFDRVRHQNNVEWWDSAP